MIQQPSIFDFKPSKGGATLVACLYRRGWVMRKMLCPLLGLDEKQIRDEAAASGGRVISGQKGYCLIEEATLDEIEHSAAWLISQGKKMISRGLEIRRRSHKRDCFHVSQEAYDKIADDVDHERRMDAESTKEDFK